MQATHSVVKFLLSESWHLEEELYEPVNFNQTFLIWLSVIADLCSSDSTMELGTGSFSLVCSGTNRLNSADGECVASCAADAYEVTDSVVSLCSKWLSLYFLSYPEIVSCSDHCATCDSTECLTCDTNYLLYDGGCVDSCPAKFYPDHTSCIGKHYFKGIFVIYPSALACPQDHCAECDASGCKVCDSGYQLKADKTCEVKPSITTTEEAGSSGGTPGGVIAAIVCGSVVFVAIAGWLSYSFLMKKFPFTSKRFLFCFWLS